MDEDYNQIFVGNAVENTATMRHLELNMLRAETSKVMSKPRKKRKAHIDESYLEKVVMAGLGVDKK